MTGQEGLIRGIQQVLNEGYGDNSASSLDRVVATNLVNYMRRTGWMTPEEVAIIVESAGGKVVIPETLLVDDITFELKSFHDIATNTVVLSTRSPKVIPGEIVDDRPEIEHREVHSGPIKVSPIRRDDSSGEEIEEDWLPGIV